MINTKQKHIAIFSHGKTPRLGALELALNAANISWEIFELSKGEKIPTDVNEFDGVILMGGPMGVYERDTHNFLNIELKWVEKMIAAGKPVFGICLGCQMLAHLYGGKVTAGSKGFSVGFREFDVNHTDKVFGQELVGHKVFTWHGDTYTLGEGCSRLIKGDIYEEQAAKFDENVYGVQFHPEITEEIVSNWYERDIQNNCLPKCAKPLDECLKQAALSLPSVHKWLEQFIVRLFAV